MINSHEVAMLKYQKNKDLIERAKNLDELQSEIQQLRILMRDEDEEQLSVIRDLSIYLLKKEHEVGIIDEDTYMLEEGLFRMNLIEQKRLKKSLWWFGIENLLGFLIS